MNKKYNPFEIQLDGWSENVMENVDDYDEVFEELYVKYRSKMHVAPEIKLIMMLGGSAMMFHLTNSMFKSVMPNMNDVIKQNPGLVQNMMSAVQNTVPKSQQGSEPSSDGKHEMQGPGFDISSLMGNIMMPPTPPMNTTSIPAQEPVVLDDDDDDDISDIAEAPTPGDVEGGGDGELREVKVTQTKAKRGRKKKSVEINL
jgi:tetrahydromethanopterin S-methyltransferase subunit B